VKKPSFLSQVSHYVGGEVLRQLAGLISFPTFTRIFSQAQYGMMSVVNSTVPMVMPFAKCGMSFASERYYSEYRAKGQEDEFFATTIIFSSIYCLIFCIVYAGLCGAALYLLPHEWLDRTMKRLLQLLTLVGILIFLKAQLAILMQIARARQETVLYNAATTVETYACLGFSLGLLFTLGVKIELFFLGQMLGTGVVLAFVMYRLSRKMKIKRSLYRKEIVRETLRYGTPLIWNEIAAVAQAMADRYVLLFLLNEEAVGLYSVGFNVTIIVISLTFSPVYSTLGPVVFQRYADGGEEAARAFLQPVCRWMLRVLFPIVAGVIATAQPLVLLLASEKYREAALVTQLNFAGLALWNLANMLGLAILLSKKTKLHRNVVLLGTFVNVGLAIVLVRGWGVEGAAVAAAATSVLSAVILLIVAYKLLPMKIYGVYLVPSMLAEAAMYWAIVQVHLGHPASTLFARVGLGIAIYVPLLLGLDKEARTDAKGFLAKAKAKLGR
jgi:O-antigen/teichoic acid export membrane protein